MTREEKSTVAKHISMALTALAMLIGVVMWASSASNKAEAAANQVRELEPRVRLVEQCNVELRTEIKGMRNQLDYVVKLLEEHRKTEKGVQP